MSQRQKYLRAQISHIPAFVYMQEFGYFILLGACPNKGNPCETTYFQELNFL